MYIADFVWLPEVVDKLAVKHNVTQDEVEDVFFNEVYYRFVEKGKRSSEDVYAALGRANSGRYLIVFFSHKVDSSALSLSARDMERRERRRYERR